MKYAHNDFAMSASEHIEVRRTFRGNVTRIGGALAGIALALSVQPFAANARANADAHFNLYTQHLTESGMTWGVDFDIQPGDKALVDQAHAEEAQGTRWQRIGLAAQGGAALLLAGGVVISMAAARRQETAVATWSVATHAMPVGK